MKTCLYIGFLSRYFLKICRNMELTLIDLKNRTKERALVHKCERFRGCSQYLASIFSLKPSPQALALPSMFLLEL